MIRDQQIKALTNTLTSNYDMPEEFAKGLAEFLYDEGYHRVPEGEWVFKEYGENSFGNLTRIYECSLCGRTIECSMEADEVYCHCGAMNIREERRTTYEDSNNRNGSW